ncbi:MAG: LD-carboxypeptidase [Oscillospiraceae bacterium]|jgi:muramoyltetrapeptide carboxypeptidase|nr:LD-carboxypeptidase [Oscillospiraceae bacterium]
MIKPRHIEPGDTVALVQPAGEIRSEGGFEKAVEDITALGYKVKAAKRGKYGYLAGTDKERADEINLAFADPEVKAVICMKGGYGSPRILDALDYNVIRVNPKIFWGYSDITALHIAFNQECELITFHGPMPASCFPLDNASLKSMLDTLSGAESGLFCNGLEVIRGGGDASGILCGGNLTLAASSLGTKWEIDTKGKILFLEDVGEKTYRIDNMLTQLRLAGKFDDCSGVVLGDFTDCPVEYPDFGLTLDEIFADIIAPGGKPVLAGLPAGHGEVKLTLPLGAMCEISGGTFRVTERATA